ALRRLSPRPPGPVRGAAALRPAFLPVLRGRGPVPGGPHPRLADPLCGLGPGPPRHRRLLAASTPEGGPPAAPECLPVLPQAPAPRLPHRHLLSRPRAPRRAPRARLRRQTQAGSEAGPSKRGDARKPPGSMNAALVTGAAGFIGRRLVGDLAS